MCVFVPVSLLFFFAINHSEDGMGAGTVPVGVQDTLAHLSDPRRTWYDNKRWVSFVVVLLVLMPVDRLIILQAICKKGLLP